MVLIYKNIPSPQYSLITHLRNSFDSYFFNSYYIDKDFRPASFPASPSPKKGILLLGCSYTFGLGLNTNDTFSSKLSDYTGRVVYNLGINGGSPRDALYILRNPDFKNKLFPDNNIEYIIYTFISDQLPRLLFDMRLYFQSPYFKYMPDGSLKYFKKNRFLLKSSIYQLFLRRKYFKLNYEKNLNGKKQLEYKYCSDLFFQYMFEINREIKKCFPEAEFVFFVYENEFGLDFKPLEKEGITVKYLDLLTDKNLHQDFYHLSHSDFHPNASAWDIVVNALVDDMRL